MGAIKSLMRIKLTMSLLVIVATLFGCGTTTNYKGMTDSKGNVPKDAKEAMAWMMPLAMKGDKDAQFNVGLLYEKGEGTFFRALDAMHWYKYAAQQGHLGAMHNIAGLYEKGLTQENGGHRSPKDAALWYRIAANQGYAPSQNNLGVLLLNGSGVPQDYREAFKWFRLAADQGLALAQRNLTLPQMILIAQQSAPPQPSYQNPVESRVEDMIEIAKNKCADLGFKINTKSFGQCVLKLSK